MGAILGALGIICACIGLAVLGLWLSRRHLQPRVPRQNDLSAAVLGVIGTLYGVLLALITITVLERNTLVEGLIVKEASLVWDLYRHADGYPAAMRAQVRQDLRDYVDADIRDEWPAMRQKRESDVTSAVVTRLIAHLDGMEPRTTGDAILHLAVMERTDDFVETRRERIMNGRLSLSRLLWIVMITGTVVVIGSSYVLWAESLQAHVLLTAALATMIGLTLYPIAWLDHPLWGRTQNLSPEYFDVIRQRMSDP